MKNVLELDFTCNTEEGPILVKSIEDFSFEFDTHLEDHDNAVSATLQIKRSNGALFTNLEEDNVFLKDLKSKLITIGFTKIALKRLSVCGWYERTEVAISGGRAFAEQILKRLMSANKGK